MSYGQRMKSLRGLLGLKQAELEAELGLKKDKIKNIETEKHKITIELSEMIEQKYSINGWWLLTGKGEMHLNKDTTHSVVGDNNITAGGTINGNVSINTSQFNHKEDVLEIIELLQYAPSGFLTIIKEKLLAFKKLSEF